MVELKFNRERFEGLLADAAEREGADTESLALLRDFADEYGADIGSDCRVTLPFVALVCEALECSAYDICEIVHDFGPDAAMCEGYNCGKCGDEVFWSVAGEVTYIFGRGEIYDYKDHSEFDISALRCFDYPEPPYFPCRPAVIMNGITSIGSFLFEHRIMKTVSIPRSVKRIADHAFANTDIDRMVIPDSVESVGIAIFEDRSNEMGRLAFHTNISELSGPAFYTQSGAKEIYLTWKRPPDLKMLAESGIFEGLENKKVYYPRSWDGKREFVHDVIESLLEYGRRTDEARYADSVHAYGSIIPCSGDMLAAAGVRRQGLKRALCSLDEDSIVGDCYIRGHSASRHRVVGGDLFENPETGEWHSAIICKSKRSSGTSPEDIREYDAYFLGDAEGEELSALYDEIKSLCVPDCDAESENKLTVALMNALGERGESRRRNRSHILQRAHFMLRSFDSTSPAYLVKKGGLYGVIDPFGKTVVDVKYNEITPIPFEELCGFYDLENCGIRGSYRAETALYACTRGGENSTDVYDVKGNKIFGEIGRICPRAQLVERLEADGLDPEVWPERRRTTSFYVTKRFTDRALCAEEGLPYGFDVSFEFGTDELRSVPREHPEKGAPTRLSRVDTDTKWLRMSADRMRASETRLLRYLIDNAVRVKGLFK